MKKIKLTEDDLVRMVKNVIKEYENFEDDIDPDQQEYEDPSNLNLKDLEDDKYDDPYIDKNFDKMDAEIDDEEGFSPSMRNKSVSKRISKIDPDTYHKSEWKKEYEKPYSPIKNSDMPLDKFLASKFK